jgi:hypothetical protein
VKRVIFVVLTVMMLGVSMPIQAIAQDKPQVIEAQYYDHPGWHRHWDNHWENHHFWHHHFWYHHFWHRHFWR